MFSKLQSDSEEKASKFFDQRVLQELVSKEFDGNSEAISSNWPKTGSKMHFLVSTNPLIKAKRRILLESFLIFQILNGKMDNEILNNLFRTYTPLFCKRWGGKFLWLRETLHKCKGFCIHHQEFLRTHLVSNSRIGGKGRSWKVGVFIKSLTNYEHKHSQLILRGACGSSQDKGTRLFWNGTYRSQNPSQSPPKSQSSVLV